MSLGVLHYVDSKECFTGRKLRENRPKFTFLVLFKEFKCLQAQVYVHNVPVIFFLTHDRFLGRFIAYADATFLKASLILGYVQNHFTYHKKKTQNIFKCAKNIILPNFVLVYSVLRWRFSGAAGLLSVC